MLNVHTDGYNPFYAVSGNAHPATLTQMMSSFRESSAMANDDDEEHSPLFLIFDREPWLALDNTANKVIRRRL